MNKIYTIIVLFIIPFLVINGQNNIKKHLKNKYADNSVLSKGNWKKIRIKETGIYKITYSKLKSWGIKNPQNVAIYGNGGFMLPEANSEFRNDDLVENPILHHNKAIYFYAQGIIKWEYNQYEQINYNGSYIYGLFIPHKHLYSNYAYYFITEKDTKSKQLEESTLQNGTPDIDVDYFNGREYHEKDLINFIKSGKKWYGEKFISSSQENISKSFEFNFPDIVKDSPVKVRINLAARSLNISYFNAILDGYTTPKVKIYRSSQNINDGYYAREANISEAFKAKKNKFNIDVIYYNSGNNTAAGYLDAIYVNAKQKLNISKNQLLFRNYDIINNNKTAKYYLQKSSDNIVIWDVTNPTNPLKVKYDVSDKLTFVYEANTLKEFVAFDLNKDFPTPEFDSDVENQNLHSQKNIDYIIVAPEKFKEQAERIGQLHLKYDEMSYIVATTQQIYNEFSSGQPDATAIRSFAKMLYDKSLPSKENAPKVMLLFGDGSYDNLSESDNTNVIPTYQSENSTYGLSTFVTDDYFGILDDDEGADVQHEKLDIGIGRFPVNTEEEAKAVVDKSYYYYEKQSTDNWRTKITFMSDDLDGGLHMRSSEDISKYINQKYPEYNINKIYLDSYKKVSSALGFAYPEAEKAIKEDINNGTLIWNYTGHGNTKTLAAEKVIDNNSILNLRNINKLPLFITATCEFSRFDEKNETSAGESVLLNPYGGGIALFTTVRVVLSSLNKEINESMYNYIFEKDEKGKPLCFGNIIMQAKNNISNSINKLNFTLLGDPALHLNNPQKIAEVTKINGKDISLDNDTIKALSKITIEGEILNYDNIKDENFNGNVYINVFDKENIISTRGNNGEKPFTYTDYNELIFSGIANVVNGSYNIEFIAPKDLKFNYGKGKISMYANDNKNNSAFGTDNNIIIGGINPKNTEDTTGPEIKLFLNSNSFKEGDKTYANPVLIADISDSSGINMSTGNIGHEIIYFLDGDISKQVNVSSLYVSKKNDFTSGSFKTQLFDLPKGKHTITVRAWDSYNNSSMTTIEFNVVDDISLKLNNFKVYPNPLKNSDNLHFSFNHNFSNYPIIVDIYIYSLGGNMLLHKKSNLISITGVIEPIVLEKSELQRVIAKPGMYIYKVNVETEDGNSTFKGGKLIITQ